MPADTQTLPVPPAPRPGSGPYRVCFVCLGNICRSPMADVVLRAELARHGYDGSAHRARQFQPSWFGDRDLVLAMDRANLADLREMAPDPAAAGRVLLFRSFDPALDGDDRYEGQVPDPYGGSPEDYAVAYGLVRAAVRGLTGQLAGLLQAPAAEPGGR